MNGSSLLNLPGTQYLYLKSGQLLLFAQLESIGSKKRKTILEKYHSGNIYFGL